MFWAKRNNLQNLRSEHLTPSHDQHVTNMWPGKGGRYRPRGTVALSHLVFLVLDSHFGKLKNLDLHVTRAISMFAGSTNGSINANQIPPLGMIYNPSQINICISFVPSLLSLRHLSSICLTIYLNLFGLTNLTQKGYLIKICWPICWPNKWRNCPSVSALACCRSCTHHSSHSMSAVRIPSHSFADPNVTWSSTFFHSIVSISFLNASSVCMTCMRNCSASSSCSMICTCTSHQELWQVDRPPQPSEDFT